MVDNQSETRDFLASRRARLTPEQAGLRSYGAPRRVKGLRREEVATLAGVSVDYYNRMERGNLAGVSESVLHAVATALQLDDAERSHLADLARTANGTPGRPRRAPRQPPARQAVQLVLDGMTALPAYARNGRLDILAVNRLGAALLPHLAPGTNLARYLLLDPRSQELYADWETVARDCVASLRTEAGRDPFDRALTDLVGELSTRSEPFRTWWAAHDVRVHASSTKHLRHPVAGPVEVTGQALVMVGDPGTVVVVYTVEPESASARALQFLDSWAGSVPGETEQPPLWQPLRTAAAVTSVGGRGQEAWAARRRRTRHTMVSALQQHEEDQDHVPRRVDDDLRGELEQDLEQKRMDRRARRPFLPDGRAARARTNGTSASWLGDRSRAATRA